MLLQRQDDLVRFLKRKSHAAKIDKNPNLQILGLAGWTSLHFAYGRPGLTIDFHGIVAGLRYTSVAEVEPRICPDQYIGWLSELEVNRAIQFRAAAQDRPEERALIIVLESPHTSEFVGPPAPAMGKTGQMIAAHTRQTVGIPSGEDLPVILLNAIQHQCSLGRKPREWRDRVFIAVWNEGGGRADFQQRLNQTYRRGDIIACCCTQGRRIDKLLLAERVYAAILETLPVAQTRRRFHPSSWYKPQNRNPVDWAVSGQLATVLQSATSRSTSGSRRR
jgi:hypothetical protein